MPSKVIREPHQIGALVTMILKTEGVVTVTWSKGEPRSLAQNRLAQRWFSDIARHLGDQQHEDVRAECKLRFGVPILRAENEAFCASYDAVMKQLPYAQKLAAVKAFDLPVTRLMTAKQMTAFMDEMQRHWIAEGVRLTDPEAVKYEMEFL